ncbi:hypothetical protein Pint_25627 [Pistacia integerrima]|uniref:Uncharacterized protein n=1 Tax=Pistacia integerrima TaxID=434235 RepID=A0ACC0YAW3_9ROSI|nr:hypothetical protein Pint_25627 [Pistacia integerrima]
MDTPHMIIVKENYQLVLFIAEVSLYHYVNLQFVMLAIQNLLVCFIFVSCIKQWHHVQFN